MAERLREVADHLAAARVDFLGQQAHVVDSRHRAPEGGGGPVELSGQCLRVRQPERAEQEGSLLPRQAVMSQVAVHQAALVGQPPGDGVDGRLHPRVVARQEAGDRQHQAGCVKILAAEGLGEGTGLLVPAALEDGRADLVAGGGPLPGSVCRAELRGQGDRPVERHPAHQLGVQEVPWLTADFPDSLVLLGPPARGRIRRGGQELPRDRVRLAELSGQPVRGAEQLAVYVKLALLPRPVADAYGPAGPPASQVLQFPLGKVVLAADTEHDLEIGPARQLRCCGVSQEPEELAGLMGACRNPQRIHGQAGIADPGIAVIPVALAADGLRQGGRGCGDDRPGRLERERLQHPAGMQDKVTPGTLIGLVKGRPRAPSFQRVLQPGGDLLGVPRGRRRLPQLSVLECEAHGLPGAQVEARGRSGPAELEPGRRGKQEPAGAATGGDASGDQLQDRVDQAVFGTRRIRDIDVEFSLGALQPAHQYSRRPGAQPMAAVVAAHRHGVGQHGGAGLRPEGGLQGYGLVDVAATDLEVTGRADREMAAVNVKDASEHGRRVEPGAT